MLVRHRNHTGLDSRALQRAAERGELIKLRSGAYVLASVWKGLNRDERIRLEVAAAKDVHRGTFIASHRSAAALWGMPRIQKHDGLVHQRVSLLTGSRTEAGLRKHAVDDVDLHLDVIDGIEVTTLERTVLDMAATEPFSARSRWRIGPLIGGPRRTVSGRCWTSGGPPGVDAESSA